MGPTAAVRSREWPADTIRACALRTSRAAPPSMPFISAVSVSPGLCLGPVHVVRARQDAAPIWSIRAREVEAEISRLDRAVASVTEVLERRRADVAAAVGERDAGILGVHQMILQDPGARPSSARPSGTRGSTRRAVERLIGRLERRWTARRRPTGLRGDVTEPWRAVVAALSLSDKETTLQTAGKSCWRPSSPEAVTFLPREQVLGVVTEAGGR